nr:antibiotic biosynthesis monooxygenase [Bacillus sp. FJAT-50079]
MKKFEVKHYEEQMYLMQSLTCQLWHETPGPSIFQSPRKYEVIDSAGKLSAHGFVASNHLAISDEGRPIFEYEIKNLSKMLIHKQGFIALRVLRPLTTDTYIVMTMWQKESELDEWKNSGMLDHVTVSKSVLSGPSFLSTFYVDDEEIEFFED